MDYPEGLAFREKKDAGHKYHYCCKGAEVC
jgi:hypothetical protein